MKDCFSVFIVRLFFITVFGIAAVIHTAYAEATLPSQRVKIAEDKGHVKFAVLLEAGPRFSLRTSDDNTVILILLGVSATSALAEQIAKNETISIEDTKKSTDLNIKIPLSALLKRVDVSWFSDDKLLYIEFSPNEDAIKESLHDKVALKSIRFGFKDKATRMVMGLDRMPIWTMTYNDSTQVNMRLNVSQNFVKEKNYGPIKWIREVSVQKAIDNSIDLSLQLEADLNHFSIFWMEVGNRLVMDLFQDPLDRSSDQFLSTAREENLNEKSMKTKGNTENLSSVELASVETNDGGSGGDVPAPIIRMKIPRREGTVGGEENKKNTSGNGLDYKLFIAPTAMDKELTKSVVTIKTIDDLTPQEAFLSGRINQAFEINDYSKAAILIDQFLDEFPESKMIEQFVFIRGDTYYQLWKNGDQDAGGMAIQSYKYAVDHYRSSERIPMAYINMARIHSELNNDYTAIGHLGLVLNNNQDNNEYQPLAYITRGKIYFKLEQYEDGIKDFKKLLEKFPDSEYTETALFFIADYYHAMGLYEEAEKRLREIEESSPDFYLDHPEFLYLMAQNYLYLHKYNPAREYLFRALNLGNQPESVDLLLSRIGDTYYHQENMKRAENLYRMVIDYYPGSEGAGIAKLRLADYFSDITILDDLRNENTNESLGDLALLEKSYQLYEKGQFQGTLETLSQLINKPIQTETRDEARRLYYDVSMKLINRLYEEKRYDELVDIYLNRRMEMMGNVSPEFLFFVGKTFNILKQHAEALSVLSEIKDFELERSSRGKYFIELATAYINEGDIEKARSLLEEKSKDDLEIIDLSRMSLILADIYQEESRHKEAVAIYQELIKEPWQLPEDEIARAYLSLGTISEKMNRFDQAETLLERCIIIAENLKGQEEILQMAYIELGKTLHAGARHKNAIKYFERGFSLGYGPDRADYWQTRYQLALSYIETGDYMKSEPLLAEISEEGDPLLQQMAQIKLGSIGLEKHLSRLSINTK